MGNTSLLVSVIIPVYNSSKFLDECINSLINQNYRNLQLIFVNDASTDTSELILRRYSEVDERIEFYTTQHNGASEARNYGLSKALGEVLIFCDSDDFLSEDFVSSAMDRFNNHIDIVVLNLKSFKLNEKNEILFIPNRKYEIDNFQGVFKLDQKNNRFFLLNQFLFDKISVSQSNKAFRREFLEKNNLKFSDESMGEDIVFMFNCLLKANSILRIEEGIYYYRIHSESTTGNVSRANLIDLHKGLDKIRMLIIGNKFYAELVNCYKFYCFKFGFIFYIQNLLRPKASMQEILYLQQYVKREIGFSFFSLKLGIITLFFYYLFLMLPIHSYNIYFSLKVR